MCLVRSDSELEETPMTNADEFAVELRDDVVAGPVRRPGNASKDAKGSIHDDETAQKLGFRGGTVAANIHFEQFPPLMEAVFGPEWHRRGGLSLYFLSPTTDGEPVQAFARRLPDSTHPLPRADVWMEDAQGARVCEGTATLGGPDPDSALRRRLQGVRPATDLRLLRDSHLGDEVSHVPSRLRRDHTDPRLEHITEPMPFYRDKADYGEIVAAPSVAIDAMRVVEAPLFRPQSAYVGMFGAIELQFLDGPVFVEHDYLADGRALALSESPKTEIVWYESVLKDAKSGRPVAQMILMSRLLKASSPLWS
jgi:hypothetical protein